MRLQCDETALQGQLHFDHALRKLNSWGVGGCCDCFYAPSSVNDLQYFLQNCIDDRQPVRCLGLGSNVLIRDGGIRGVVISLRNQLGVVRHKDCEVMAEAGASCARLARYGAEHGLSGLEFLVGVPGTVGGALFMNAGAFGRSVWDYVTRVETIDRSGALHHRTTDDFSVAYRQVKGRPDEWFVRGHFILDHETAGDGQKKIRALLKRRRAMQPIGQLSCGSVFRNPQGDYAARLIEACGLKSHRIGGAQVSDKHANFIINTGRATSAEIEALIAYLRKTVLSKTGVELMPEVHVVGEKLC